MLHSTELNTFGMTNTFIYRDLRRATGDSQSIEGVELPVLPLEHLIPLK